MTPDAAGNGFINVAIYQAQASGLSGPGESGCRTSAFPQNPVTPRARRGAGVVNSQLPCDRADLRDLYFGLLGPQAVSITYPAANGRLVSEPTTGSDGAYLVVRRAQSDSAHPVVRVGAGTGYTYDAGLFQGSVRAVRYRDGHTCRVPGPSVRSGASCPTVGYVQGTTPLPTATEATSKISVRVEASRYYCNQAPPSQVVLPCSGVVPNGFSRINTSRGTAHVLVVISFVSKVAITDGHSYYYFEMTHAPHTDLPYARDGNGVECGRGARDFGQTNSNYREGQRVTQYVFENLSCRGQVLGNVSLVVTTGPATPAPTNALRGQSIRRNVGQFSFNVP